MNQGQWSRVVDLFDQMRNLSGPERVALVERERLPPHLRDELDGLLAADDAAFPLLDDVPLHTTAQHPPGPPEWAPPREVGPYRILGTLGRGGMGVVYLAERDDVDMRVALKLVDRRSATKEGLERFGYERRVLARLEHPNIARLLDAGIAEDGSPWFAMEYVRGRSIEAHADMERLDVAARLSLLEKVARAMAYAHRNLVVHRDLKPSNVLVTEDGEPKIVDFGIAKLVAGDEAGGDLTRAGMRVMTPNYASPEQYAGLPVTTASDVYQLGILGHELLTGSRPCNAPGEAHAPWGGKPPAPPSGCVAPSGGPATPEQRAAARCRRTTPEGLQRTLSGDLDHVILKALATTPEERYPSAQEMADDLDRYRRGLPLAANPGSLWHRGMKLMARHRVAAGLALAMGGLVTVATIALAYQANRIAQERDRAERVADVLSQVVQQADPTADLAENSTGNAVFGDAEAEALAGLESDPGTWAEIVLLIARTHSNLGNLDRATELRRSVVTSLEGRVPPDDPHLLQARSQLGTLLAEAGRVEEALPLLEAAAAEASSLSPERRAELADVLIDLGFGRQIQGEIDLARSAYDEALGVLGALPDSGGAILGRLLINLGYVEQGQGNLLEAEALFRRTLGLRTRLLGPDATATANATASLANILLQLDQVDEADDLSRRALEVRREAFEPPHGDLAASLELRGRVLFTMGQVEEGIETMEEALTMYGQVYGRPHMTTAYTATNLGGLLFREGRLEEARSHQRIGLREYTAVLGDDHLSTNGAAIELADTEGAIGRVDIAWDLYDRAAPKLEASIESGPMRAYLHIVRAGLLQASGRCPEAVATLDDLPAATPSYWSADNHWLLRADSIATACAS